MSDGVKCVAGCASFYAGEKRHHKDCPHYPESLTKANADRIEELEAKLSKAVEGLKKSQQEIDGYIRQEYPQDTPLHERYRMRDFSANPARTTLAELTKEHSNEKERQMSSFTYAVVHCSEKTWCNEPNLYVYNHSKHETLEEAEQVRDAFREVKIPASVLALPEKK